MGYLIAPGEGLAIAFGQGGKRTAGPEGIPHIADGSLHAPFLIPRAQLARLRREMVVCAPIEQVRIEKNLAAAPLQHGGLEIVVENRARLAVPGLKACT
jgi:hypothetical protein